MSLILHRGTAPMGGLKTALTLLFESLLGLGTSLPSVGKPCTGTRAGLGTFWEGPSWKHCVNSGPATVGCPLSRERDWGWYFD